MKTHILWLIAVIGALFVGTRFTKQEVRIVEKPVEIVRTVEKPIEVVRTKEVVVEKPVEVTKEVVKVVPKEIEKIVERRVEVPAEIPEIYKTARIFLEQFRNSKALSSEKEALAGVDSVDVRIFLTDEIKQVISESEIRTKFEITLRRSGIPIDEKSRFTLRYNQEGLTDAGRTLIYSSSVVLLEFVLGFRNGDPAFKHQVESWRRGHFGKVGLSRARDAMLADAESDAEKFANDWLAMNSKR